MSLPFLERLLPSKGGSSILLPRSLASFITLSARVKTGMRWSPVSIQRRFVLPVDFYAPFTHRTYNMTEATKRSLWSLRSHAYTFGGLLVYIFFVTASTDTES